jgi:tRNA pseudouridine38-40 synthase
MMKNIQLTIAYDGSRYLGWQQTPTGMSIEACIKAALEQILQHEVHLQAASRTDAGVHAIGQIANFFSDKTFDIKRLQISMNQLLPKDIAILDVAERGESFHPTLDCKSKAYEYSVCCGKYQLPQRRLFSWHYPYEIDLEQMRSAIPVFIGFKDFTSFTNHKKNETYEHHFRRVLSIEVVEKDFGTIVLRLTGEHFMYKMVRNIVGTLVYVGNGKIELDDVRKIMTSGDRTEAGPTAPAHGLTLVSVVY